MAFKSNLLQNIHVCQQCNGYGVLNPQDPISKHKDCPSCTGDGVYIKKGKDVYIFGMPPFVNYESRAKHILIRYISVGIAIFIAIVLMIIVLT